MDRTSPRIRYGSVGDLVAGSAAGLIGGLAGAFIMNQMSPVLERVGRLVGESAGEDRSEVPSENQSRRAGENGSDDSVSSTVKVAQAVSRTVAGHDIPRDLRPAAGNVVHYAFGALNGAVYGALAVIAPGVTTGRGLLFGAGLWATADEMLLPLVGLSKPPTRYPASTHAVALASHVVYGLTVDAVRRGMRGTGGHRAEQVERERRC